MHDCTSSECQKPLEFKDAALRELHQLLKTKKQQDEEPEQEVPKPLARLPNRHVVEAIDNAFRHGANFGLSSFVAEHNLRALAAIIATESLKAKDL